MPKSDKPKLTLIEAGTKILMTPRDFAKLTGLSEHEIRAKCKSGKYPHQVKHTKGLKPYYRVLVPETLEIIRKECMKNAPLAPREKTLSPADKRIQAVLKKALG